MKVGAGMPIMFHRNVGVPAEYRFSHFSPSYEGFDNDINTHKLQFGLTLRFYY